MERYSTNFYSNLDIQLSFSLPNAASLDFTQKMFVGAAKSVQRLALVDIYVLSSD